MIQSLLGDETCSWVLIVNGINKNVTEMTETQDDHIDCIGERTEKPVAKALRFHTTSVNGSTWNQVRSTEVALKCYKR